MRSKELKNADLDTRIMVPLTIKIPPLVDELAEVYKLSPRKIMESALSLGLLFAKYELDESKDNETKLYFKHDENLERVKIFAKSEDEFDEDGVPTFQLGSNQPDIIDLEPTIDPSSDLNSLLRNYSFDRGKHYVLGTDPTQLEQVQQIAQISAANIQRRFKNYLNPSALLKLDKIHEGTAVIKNLNEKDQDILSNINLPYYLKPLLTAIFWLADKTIGIKLISKTNGLKVQDYDAVLLDEGVFDRGNIPHIVTHEILHNIGENNLPELLNEAATDIYADRANDTDTHPENRLMTNFGRVFEIWKWIEQTAGEEVAFEAYLEPACIELTYHKEPFKIVSERFVGLKLHEIMREKLGQDSKGRERWDRAIDLIRANKIHAAYDIFFPRSFARRITDYIRDLKLLKSKIKS